jgi:hypothetical protein
MRARRAESAKAAPTVPCEAALLELRKDRDDAVLQGTGGAGPALSPHRSTLPAMMCSPSIRLTPRKETKMPKLEESIIQNSHPTQLTVGMIEVEDKTKHLASLKAQEQRDFMQAHPIPAVKGPQGALFITDHHHLARAALEAVPWLFRALKRF